MGQLFLYGGFADNFEAMSAPFIKSAGGVGARIALLLPHNAERFIDRYRIPWLNLGAAEVCVIQPQGDSLQPEAMAQLQTCTGIFMPGGDTRVYHQLYASGEVRERIRDRYHAGVPYAGLSAGALVTPSVCSIWGDHLQTTTNTLRLRGSEDGCQEPLQVGEGLGLLPHIITEAHFSERGGFPRLVAAMEQSGMAYGLGFDDPICLEMTNALSLKVHGRGRAYFLKRLGATRLEIVVLEPGQELTLPTFC